MELEGSGTACGWCSEVRGGGVLICALWRSCWEFLSMKRVWSEQPHEQCSSRGELGWREERQGTRQEASAAGRMYESEVGLWVWEKQWRCLMVHEVRCAQLTLWQSQAAAGDTSLLAFSHFLFPLLFLFILATLILHPYRLLALSKTCSSTDCFLENLSWNE